MRLKLETAPTFFRAPVSRGAPARVDREARTIRGFAAITAGVEALGHGLWIDEDMAAQVAKLGQYAEPRGVKSRYTHPGMCSDGLGRALGRAENFRLEGGVVRADLALADFASRAPEGDLAGYVLELADEDPEAFGASIVFERDTDAELAFMLANGAELDGDYLDLSGFRSPDARNARNLPHVRVAALRAVDVVDEPAANPAGFFSAGLELEAAAEAFAGYALGLTEARPEASSFGLDPERARRFVVRFLDSHGLAVVQANTNERTAGMANTETKAAAAAENQTPTTPAAPKAATLGELRAAFAGESEFILEQLERGATFEQAQAAFSALRIERLEAERDKLQAEREQLQAEREQLQAKASSRTGAEPLAFDARQDANAGGDFLELARAIRDERHPDLTTQQRMFKVGMREAVKLAAKRYPEAYAAWRASNNVRPILR